MRTKTRGLFAKGKRILCTISHIAALIFKKIFAGFCVLNWRLLTRKPINSLNETNGIVEQFQWNRWTISMELLNEINGFVTWKWRFCGVNVAFVASKSDGEGGECWYMLVLESQQNSVCNGNGSGRGNSAWKPDWRQFTSSSLISRLQTPLCQTFSCKIYVDLRSMIFRTDKSPAYYFHLILSWFCVQ